MRIGAIFVTMLLLALPLVAQFGERETEEFRYVVLGYQIPPSLQGHGAVPETPDGSGKGIHVTVTPKDPELKWNSLTVVLQYRDQQGKLWRRMQVLPKRGMFDKNAAGVFWVGDVTPLAVVAVPMVWESQPEADFTKPPANTGAANCSGVADGWFGVDITTDRLYQCIGGVARYAVLQVIVVSS